MELTLSDSQLERLSELVSAHPEEFAGASLDEAKREVVVRWVKTKNPQAIAALMRRLPALQFQEHDGPWKVRLVPVARSQKRLDEVFEQLDPNASDPRSRALKPIFVSAYVDSRRNVVVVGVTAITDRLRYEMRERFGTDVELKVMKSPQLRSRTNPSSPFIGGTRLVTPLANGTSRCTAGFAVADSVGNRGFLTAAHCVLDPSYNQPAWDDLRYVHDEQGDSWIGYFAHWNFANKRVSPNNPWRQKTTDAALIGGLFMSPEPNYRGQIYLGGPTSSTTANVKRVNTGTPMNGLTVCYSGATTGEQCGAEILTTQGMMMKDGFTVKPVAMTWGGYVAAGDSGGPVYYYNSDGRLTALGIINASKLEITGCMTDPITSQMICNANLYDVFVLLRDALPAGWTVLTR